MNTHPEYSFTADEKRLGDTDRLRILREDECAGELTPLQANPETTDALNDREIQDQLEDSGIRRVEALLDGEWQRRILALTPQAWAAMSPIEQANAQSWLERRIKVLSERLCMMRRNAKAEPEVPAVYMGRVS